ncbi:MAG TPA: M56 family metallopeptidase, partial [Pirellulaceae bacterium]|nr:M56 family metallopeptidase [Pirellulaceae bacterium]
WSVSIPTLPAIGPALSLANEPSESPDESFDDPRHDRSAYAELFRRVGGQVPDEADGAAEQRSFDAPNRLGERTRFEFEPVEQRASETVAEPSLDLPPVPSRTASAIPVESPELSSDVASSPAGVAFSPTLLRVAAIIWVAGASFGLLRAASGYAALLFSLRRSRRSRGRWQRELDRACDLVETRRLTMAVHPSLGPFVCWTPRGLRLVVPAIAWKELGPARRRAILAHELGHVVRGDLWTSTLARSIALLHWFNPCAWLAARRFDEAAEWACDARLAEHSPRLAIHLAGALLEVASIPHRRAGLVAAAGGPLGDRIRRLLVPRPTGESLMRPSSLVVPLMVLLALLVLRPGIRLTEQAVGQESNTPATRAENTNDDSAGEAVRGQAESDAADDEARDDQGLDSDDRAAEIAERLIVEGLGDEQAELVREFAVALKSEPGRIVLGDRGAAVAAEAQGGFDLTIWDRFVAERFAAQEAGLVWADSAARDEFLNVVRQSREDATRIRTAIDAALEGLEPDDDLQRLVVRFLQTPGVESYLAFEERRTLHPDLRRLLEMSEQSLVLDREGKVVIRPIRRREAEAMLARFERAEPTIARFTREFADWSREIVGDDERTVRFRKHLADPALSWFLCADLVRQEAFPLENHTDYRFEQLEDATRDVADGLRLAEESEGLSAWEETFDEFEQAQAALQDWDAVIERVAEDLNRGDELSARVGRFITSPAGRYHFLVSGDLSRTTPESLVEERLGNFIETMEDGTRRFRESLSEDAEGVEQALQETFRELRYLRRRGRPVADTAERFRTTDPELATALGSDLGQTLMVSYVESMPSTEPNDGIDGWIESRFEATDEGYRLHDWASDEIRQFLEDVRALENEAGTDDF